MTFSDATVLPPWANADNAEETIKVLRSYLLAFFDRHLRGRKPSLLEQAPGQYGIAEWQVYMPNE
jgi:hypothetical protein